MTKVKKKIISGHPVISCGMMYKAYSCRIPPPPPSCRQRSNISLRMFNMEVGDIWAPLPVIK